MSSRHGRTDALCGGIMSSVLRLCAARGWVRLAWCTGAADVCPLTVLPPASALARLALSMMPFLAAGLSPAMPVLRWIEMPAEPANPVLRLAHKRRALFVVLPAGFFGHMQFG